MTSDNNWLQKATGRLLQAQTAFAMTHVGRFGRRMPSHRSQRTLCIARKERSASLAKNALHRSQRTLCIVRRERSASFAKNALHRSQRTLCIVRKERSSSLAKNARDVSGEGRPQCFGRRTPSMFRAKSVLDGKELECLFYLHTI